MKETGRRIDWDAVKARLRSVQTGTDENRARLEAVYRQRAQELAARIDQEETALGQVQVLAFALGTERYGLPLTDLAGVLPVTSWTPVPGGPAELLGVINHRGHICSVLDLARLLGLPISNPPTSRDRPGAFPDGRGSFSTASSAYIVLLRREGREVGLKVGAIEGLLRLTPDSSTGLGEATGSAGAFLSALTPDRLGILSAAAILSHPLFLEVSRE